MQYTIVKAFRTDQMEQLVNERLCDGWVLQGGVSVAMTRDQGSETIVYAQAMTKESK